MYLRFGYEATTPAKLARLSRALADRLRGTGSELHAADFGHQTALRRAGRQHGRQPRA